MGTNAENLLISRETSNVFTALTVYAPAPAAPSLLLCLLRLLLANPGCLLRLLVTLWLSSVSSVPAATLSLMAA
jgi:hypothetical protein